MISGVRNRVGSAIKIGEPRWTRCFESGCIQVKEERGRGKQTRRKKETKRGGRGKQEERKNIASRSERSETNCSFIGRAEADVEGGQEKGKAGLNAVSTQQVTRDEIIKGIERNERKKKKKRGGYSIERKKTRSTGWYKRND